MQLLWRELMNCQIEFRLYLNTVNTGIELIFSMLVLIGISQNILFLMFIFIFFPCFLFLWQNNLVLEILTFTLLNLHLHSFFFSDILLFKGISWLERYVGGLHGSYAVPNSSLHSVAICPAFYLCTCGNALFSVIGVIIDLLVSLA